MGIMCVLAESRTKCQMCRAAHCSADEGCAALAIKTIKGSKSTIDDQL